MGFAAPTVRRHLEKHLVAPVADGPTLQGGGGVSELTAMGEGPQGRRLARRVGDVLPHGREHVAVGEAGPAAAPLPVDLAQDRGSLGLGDERLQVHPAVLAVEVDLVLGHRPGMSPEFRLQLL